MLILNDRSSIPRACPARPRRRGLPAPCGVRLQLLAVLGGQFRVGDEICGLVLSVRYQEDILSIWNRSADSRKVCMQIRDTLRSTMGLPEGATMEYKKHTDSMRDNSSYRNTNANF
jgi:translation initiation factor 4E